VGGGGILSDLTHISSFNLDFFSTQHLECHVIFSKYVCISVSL